MKKAMILFSITSTLCLAETWTGKLVDATCADQSRSSSPSANSGQSTTGQNAKDMSACAPKESTTSFALQTSDGRVIKLDSAGNTKAADTFKANSKANRGDMQVTVTGTMTGDMVQVDNINAQ